MGPHLPSSNDRLRLPPVSGSGEHLDELHEIMVRLDRVLRSFGGSTSADGEPFSPQNDISPATEKSVREVIKARSRRAACFDAEIFADPAWDMLLELYAACLGSQNISVSSLCIASSVPATTALRWINVLEREGLIMRRSDPVDGRRTFVHLSPRGIAGMNRFFGSIEVHRNDAALRS